MNMVLIGAAFVVLLILYLALEVAGIYVLSVIAYFLNPWNWKYVGKSPVRDLAHERNTPQENNTSEEHRS